MDESRWTPKAVILAAVLHLGIVGFLYLAILPCSSYESFAQMLGLPASMNPIRCEKPVQLAGQVIEATLVGVTGSPPPKPVKVKPVPDTKPPQPTVPPPTPQEQQPKATLPPPPKNPDVKDQERVVEEAAQKAEEAKQLQDEKERQRQSELDAEAAKKAEKQKQIDDLFAKLDKQQNITKAALTKAQQAAQQREDLANAKDNAQPDLPKADQLQSGQNGPDADLRAQYIAAIQNAVTPNWQRPDNMPNVPCVVHIAQIVGGDVISAKVDDSCPYDEPGRRSIENAVLRTHTLPYAGFEKAFQSRINMTFRPQ